jgi:tetratricopeptide (TPR) repeat protein
MSEAQHQFQIAVALNPNYMAPVFNLGLIYQQTNQWDKAIAQYRMITELTGTAGSNSKAGKVQDRQSIVAVSERVKFESKIRECDLLQATVSPVLVI